ncbi:MAG TPA: Fur family transcriptional regulator [Micavibrio sp.]
MCGKCSPYLEQALEYCEARGLRLTEPRAQVLGIMVEAGSPLTAYEVLDELGKHVTNPKPPTVYRALEFLQDAGLVHRIESMNAYVACHGDHQHEHPGQADTRHSNQFLICDDCGQVQEIALPQVEKTIDEKAQAAGFKTQRWSAEIHGTCKACQD